MPLLLIAIMTFVLISSSGTMAMAVNYGYRHDRVKSAALMFATAAFGATFVGMQAFEWTKLILEGVRPWHNPWGAPQFGSSFFMITGFHGTHVTIGVIFLINIARKVLRGRFRHREAGLLHQPQGALRNRRNHRPLLAFRRSGLGVHFRSVLPVVRKSHDNHKSDDRPYDDSKRLRTRAATFHQALPAGLVLAVRSQHLLLSGRLFRAAR